MRYSVVYLAALVLATSEVLACPGSCDWVDGRMNYVSSFSSFDEMAECDSGVVLFEFNDDDSVNACLFDGEHISNSTNGISKPSTNAAISSCGNGGYSFSDNMVLASWGTGTSGDVAKSVAALDAIQSFMKINCESTTSFAYNSPIVAAVWAGPLIRNDLFSSSALQVLINDIATKGIPTNKAIQRCPASGVDGSTTWGAVVNTVNQAGSAIKPSVDQWSRGKCLTGFTSSITVSSGNMWALADGTAKSGNKNPDSNLNQCRFFKATKNNMSCAEIAAATGVTEYMINFLNNGICSTYIFADQPVCYSAGAMPDFKPKPNADGSCAVQTIGNGQTCASVLKMYPPLTQADLMNYNKQTYGWYGCDNGHPWVNDKICVSSGTPPRPTPNPEAECGPLAPGDKYNSECPLKACCSYSGFCGLGSDHCAIKESPTGAPGTTGCFSNCDIKYVASGPPAEFINIGYYESWSIGWQCMNAGVLAVDWSSYSHVHFAFAGVDVNVNIVMDADATSEFEIFKSMTGFKKIISFGGWGISTDPSTYQYLRNAMIPGNVGNFVTRLVNFVNSNNLDGIDIDWEYPGAPDIPGIPPGLASDGPNYLIFLRKLRAALPTNKSLSIAAPASYWYLKTFPIADMAVHLDYIVYMTYDLHGQWDYGNQWTGNYLRSHVNWTETKDALALITHAGVPSNKLLLGLGAYGRSFKQSNPDCSGPMCTFTGPASGAIPGKCTNAAGYISLAEIDEIVASGKYRSYGYDKVSDSAIMTYDTDQWVSWTTEVTMGGRVNWAKANNMGGAVVWAADLAAGTTKYTPSCNLKDWNMEEDVCSPTDIIAELNKWNSLVVSKWKDQIDMKFARLNIDSRSLEWLKGIYSKISKNILLDSDYGSCKMYDVHSLLITTDSFINNIIDYSEKWSTDEVVEIVSSFLQKFVGNKRDAIYSLLENINSVANKEILDSLSKFADDLVVNAPVFAVYDGNSCALKEIHEYIQEYQENQDLIDPFKLISSCDDTVKIPDLPFLSNLSKNSNVVVLVRRRNRIANTIYLLENIFKLIGKAKNICYNIDLIRTFFYPEEKEGYNGNPIYYSNVNGQAPLPSFNALVTMILYPWTSTCMYGGLPRSSKSPQGKKDYIGISIKPSRDRVGGSLYPFDKKNIPDTCPASASPELDEFPPQSSINNMISMDIGHDMNTEVVRASGLFVSMIQNGFEGSLLGSFHQGTGLWEHRNLAIARQLESEGIFPHPEDMRINMYPGQIQPNGVALYRGHMRMTNEYEHGIWDLPETIMEWKLVFENYGIPNLKNPDNMQYPEYLVVPLATSNIMKDFIDVIRTYNNIEEIINALWSS